MDWQEELEARKKIYRESRGGIHLDETVDSLSRTKGRSADVRGVYLPSAYGADIEAEQAFQQELHEIVDEMKVNLVDEKKILEGTLNPEYGKNEWTLPCILPCEDQNERLHTNPSEEQWRSNSPNGFLRTDPTLASICESNTSSSFAELFNRGCPILHSDERSVLSSTDSCSGRLDDCGTEIDATNEFSECTVPMTSELMLGTPNEERWLLPPRSMESSALNLHDEMS